MGKQINFYMHPEDLKKFDSVLKQEIDLKIFYTTSKENGLDFLDDVVIKKYGEERITVMLTKDLYLKNIKLNRIKENQWSVDSIFSPVLEFVRCYFDGKQIRLGRLYYQEGYYDARGLWQKHPDEFIVWCKKMCGLVEGMSKHDKQTSAYIFPHALEWRNKGGKFLFN
ncbi:MAG: hypothetical protein COU31_03160 [Candidatus Magasanikbacteria bacterium CG10_big_fil_rev_8_21_14_0_10_40_10]|uniref:Uncharacterized protein n=1 Tax=Candidatus Magasanikbacteria bacterium CG10_big_fil_rev_8_21_14_0_10_40_10 TaxID=1974648 RepID=A0A2M6W3L6_9BACT|nr:MAG: hypothetical protein COU31_03160 [Candidatus Magasanikbacteria bacterium CG10_big_fil_rev_8_21_14_0_10_40_10]